MTEPQGREAPGGAGGQDRRRRSRSIGDELLALVRQAVSEGRTNAAVAVNVNRDGGTARAERTDP